MSELIPTTATAASLSSGALVLSDVGTASMTPQWVFASLGDSTVPWTETLETVASEWASRGLLGAPDNATCNALKWTLIRGGDPPDHGAIPSFLRTAYGTQLLKWHYAFNTSVAPGVGYVSARAGTRGL